jgi:thioredoxin-like negative regulator of GroEL
MDKHLTKLAVKYYNTRFIRVFVENIPWLVEKLGIKILPCVICFVDGMSKDRLVGFEDLGNVDGFDTAALELRLLQSDVISNKKNSLQPLFKVASARNLEDDEVFDL